MLFLRKPGASKYEKAAIEFIRIFSGISNVMRDHDTEDDIDKMFTLIDVPDDKYDVFVGIVASFHMDKSAGLLVMKQISKINTTKESDNDVIEFIKSLRNKELKDIITHSVNTLRLLDTMITLVDESILQEPMFLFSSFVKYLTLLKKIKFGRTKILDTSRNITILDTKRNNVSQIHKRVNETDEILNNIM